MAAPFPSTYHRVIEVRVEWEGEGRTSVVVDDFDSVIQIVRLNNDENRTEDLFSNITTSSAPTPP